jgi:hypothetical protein
MKQINLNFQIPNWFKWIGWILFAIAIFQTCQSDPQLAVLNERNKVLQTKFTKLAVISLELAKVADSLTIRIDNRKEKIVIKEKIKYEKILSINTLTVSQYQQFFTDRYAR